MQYISELFYSISRLRLKKVSWRRVVVSHVTHVTILTSTPLNRSATNEFFSSSLRTAGFFALSFRRKSSWTLSSSQLMNSCESWCSSLSKSAFDALIAFMKRRWLKEPLVFLFVERLLNKRFNSYSMSFSLLLIPPSGSLELSLLRLGSPPLAGLYSRTALRNGKQWNKH